MYTYIYTYIHIYIHTYICIHTYIHTYTHTYIHTYIHAHIQDLEVGLFFSLFFLHAHIQGKKKFLGLGSLTRRQVYSIYTLADVYLRMCTRSLLAGNQVSLDTCERVLGLFRLDTRFLWTLADVHQVSFGWKLGLLTRRPAQFTKASVEKELTIYTYIYIHIYIYTYIFIYIYIQYIYENIYSIYLYIQYRYISIYIQN